MIFYQHWLFRTFLMIELNNGKGVEKMRWRESQSRNRGIQWSQLNAIRLDLIQLCVEKWSEWFRRIYNTPMECMQMQQMESFNSVYRAIQFMKIKYVFKLKIAWIKWWLKCIKSVL